MRENKPEREGEQGVRRCSGGDGDAGGWPAADGGGEIGRMLRRGEMVNGGNDGEASGRLQVAHTEVGKEMGEGSARGGMMVGRRPR